MAREVAPEIYAFTKRLPSHERYALSDQIRRSSRAVKAMTAEAWGRRRDKAVWISKLDEALGEATETQSWLDDAIDAGHITPEEFGRLDSDCASIGRMLSRMIDRADDFCKYTPATDYQVQEQPDFHITDTDLDEFFQ